MKWWLTKRFRALQERWYQRLADSGFVDAEVMVGGELRLCQNAHHAAPYEHPGQREARQEYYHLLRCLALVEEFDSEVDRVIMTMTADGAKQKEIEAALNELGIRRPPRFLSDKRRCRESIRLCVRKYERRWGLRQDEREAG